MENPTAIKLDIEIPSVQIQRYPIFIGTNILQDAGDITKLFTKASKILLISNETVFPLYGDIVQKSLEKAEYQLETLILKDGEDYKTMETIQTIIDKAIEMKLERKDAMVALGGGVVGDAVGYAAASYLRGISFVQIPTTLLAQVDSSVGGKVGVNHSKGKNLIGAFYQPKCVISDVTTFQTLSERDFKSGLAEVLKYAFIEKTCGLDEPLLGFYTFLKENERAVYAKEPDIIIKMVEYCCKLKAAVVQQDEKEAGLRAILNLGHTTAHALEVAGNYSLFTHGEAVSVGMIAAYKLANAYKLIEQDVLDAAENLIKQYDLPSMIPNTLDIETLIDLMKLDKKVVNNRVRFILPVKEIGKVDIYDNIYDDMLANVLGEMISLH